MTARERAEKRLGKSARSSQWEVDAGKGTGWAILALADTIEAAAQRLAQAMESVAATIVEAQTSRTSLLLKPPPPAPDLPDPSHPESRS